MLKFSKIMSSNKNIDKDIERVKKRKGNYTKSQINKVNGTLFVSF